MASSKNIGVLLLKILVYQILMSKLSDGRIFKKISVPRGTEISLAAIISRPKILPISFYGGDAIGMNGVLQLPLWLRLDGLLRSLYGDNEPEKLKDPYFKFKDYSEVENFNDSEDRKINYRGFERSSEGDEEKACMKPFIRAEEMGKEGLCEKMNSFPLMCPFNITYFIYANFIPSLFYGK